MARKTTARKTTTKKSSAKAAAKTMAKPVARRSAKPATTDVAEKTASAAPAQPKVAPKTLGKRELIDRVVTASGIKKKAAKPVVEAMLRELGDALSRGEQLNLQPFGKGIVKNRKSQENAEIVEMRLRRSRNAMAAQSDAAPKIEPRSPLAEAAE